MPSWSAKPESAFWMKVTARPLAASVDTRSSRIRIRVYGRCQRDSRRCERVQADLATPLLGGGSCCHSKLSYGMPLRLLLVSGRWRLVVTSPTSSRITYRPHREHYAPPRPRGLRRGRRSLARRARSMGPGHYTDGTAQKKRTLCPVSPAEPLVHTP